MKIKATTFLPPVLSSVGIFAAHLLFVHVVVVVVVARLAVGVAYELVSFCIYLFVSALDL